MSKKLGYIGLGNMGKPMVERLLSAGHEVALFSRSLVRAHEIAERFEAATVFDSPAAIAREADVIFLCLPDSPQVREVVLGHEDSIAAAIKPGCTIIDMSTISPVEARSITDAVRGMGGEMLDAPVSGGVEGAQAGSLTIMVGGSQRVLEDVKDLLGVLGKRITWVGEAGAGQITKACNQLSVALGLAAVAESLTLAAKAGVDPRRVAEAMQGGSADSFALRTRAVRMLDGEFEAGFKASYHLKDLDIVLNAAKQYGAVLPLSHIVREMYSSMVQNGRGDLDNCAVILVPQGLSGLECLIATGETPS